MCRELTIGFGLEEVNGEDVTKKIRIGLTKFVCMDLLSQIPRLWWKECLSYLGESWPVSGKKDHGGEGRVSCLLWPFLKNLQPMIFNMPKCHILR